MVGMVTRTIEETAASILRVLLLHQRTSTDCEEHPCPRCLRAHLPHITRAIESGEPIRLVLPAFPCKSPSARKVLGPVPDLAERLALDFLQSLCDRVESLHPPGAELVICSDGRVFGDLIHVADADISRYQAELGAMLAGHPALRLFDLDDHYRGIGHARMRALLEEHYADPFDVLRAEVRAGGEPLSLYRGVTRFLLEDSAGGPGSRSALQRDCRDRAYGVIRRSKAWGRLVGERFPHAVRLSIHPQPCGSDKLGILLMDCDDSWLTPWHGVALLWGGRYLLVKRYQAEALGAELVTVNGRPSHYRAP
ncbi:MAG: L-tyrosine/L-tryptophan isonitrile synthase family protein [Nonomuraea sp.]|nr:L-tyrosine/L-tryptophan isonitrile synthase family protein [Nonomuraea sp.]